jgi:hypothetical protein
MNNIDRQYKELLLDIIHFGIDKADRTIINHIQQLKHH